MKQDIYKTTTLPVLYATVGLPYAGKEQWAKTQGLPVISLAANESLLKQPRQTSKEADKARDFTLQMIQSLFAAGNTVVILIAENLTCKDREFWQDDSRWQTTFREFKITEREALRAAKAKGATSKAQLDQIKTKAKAYEPLASL